MRGLGWLVWDMESLKVGFSGKYRMKSPKTDLIIDKIAYFQIIDVLIAKLKGIQISNDDLLEHLVESLSVAGLVKLDGLEK